MAAAAVVTVVLTGTHLGSRAQLAAADRSPGGPPWIVRLAVVPHGRMHNVLVSTVRAAHAHHRALPARAALTRRTTAGVRGGSAGGLVPPPVRTPPWWSGVCNVNNHPGSFPLSSWDGLTACAPGPNRGGYDSALVFFPGAWGQYEWECVELSMRWLYLEYGVHPYPANGGQVVSNYSPADGGGLHAVANNGTSVPVPGDVISMGTPWEEGHTVVVTAVHVTHGYGTISVLEQNVDSGNGTNTIAVVGGVLEPEYGFPITGWLAVPQQRHHHPTPSPFSWSASIRSGNAPRVLGTSIAMMAAGSPARLAWMVWARPDAPMPVARLTGTAFWLHEPESHVFQQVLGIAKAG